MISVNDLYTRVAEDLLKKDKAGYASNAEFNRDLKDAEDMVVNYYTLKKEEGSDNREGLRHLTKLTLVTVTGSLFTLPSDYRHLESFLYHKITNITGQEPILEKVEARPIQLNERGMLLSDAIRGPSLDKGLIYYYPTDQGVRLLPDNLGSRGELLYIRNPIYGSRGVTLDVPNQQENYDVGSTTDLSWPAKEWLHFVDILLFLKGVQIRDSEIIQYLREKQLLKYSN